MKPKIASKNSSDGLFYPMTLLKALLTFYILDSMSAEFYRSILISLSSKDTPPPIDELVKFSSDRM